MSITWFYSCDNLDTSDIFDGFNSYPASFDNTTDFTNAVDFGSITSEKLGGSGSIHKLGNTFGEYLQLSDQFINVAGEGCIGLGIHSPSGEWNAGEVAWPLRGAGSVDAVRINSAGTTGAGSLDLRFSSAGFGSLTVSTGLGGSLADQTWYFVIFRWNTPREDWSFEIYDSSGSLIDIDGGLADSSTFAAWPLAANILYTTLGDYGGDTLERYYDNVMLSDKYDEPLQNYILSHSYLDTLEDTTVLGPAVITRPWTKQPPAGTQIDYSNPIARKLGFLWIGPHTG